ncbi:DsbA family protein [Macrococcoides bohemicum]|uniref:DsbA family protein n=1 Tax=Macrococcoides bohemicum TaxID=1903056 RepID=UPI00193FC7FE|nr:thioredoxin domain-containing protein [Macrococcus bohemicus]QRN48585.1 DsbA family protein [Macrococcus bohemicus]
MKNKGSLIFTMVLTLFVVGALAAMVMMKQNDKTPESESTAPVTNPNIGVKLTNDIDTKDQPQLGKENAKIKIIEFGDFKCPACRYFETDIKPDIQKKFIDTGKAEMYFIHSPFHGEESLLGGLAGETVLKQEPEKYWEFHKALFELQPNADQSWLTMNAIKKAANQAGIKDIKKLEKAIEENKESSGVNKDIDLVKKHNISATPTIIVNGKEVKNPMDINEVEKAIEKAAKS